MSLAMGPVVMMAMVLLAVQRLAMPTRAAMLNSGSPLAADVAGQPGDDEVDAAVVADGFEHASGQQGDDDELAHAGDARSHGSEPVEEGGAGIDTDNSSREDAQQQYQHDIDACYGRTQYDEVGITLSTRWSVLVVGQRRTVLERYRCPV